MMETAGDYGNEEALRDACWKLYLEHCAQARHHDVQRSTAAALILALGTALLGLVMLDKCVDLADLPLTLLLMLVGAFGALFSAKQYERAALHTQRARHYRDAADASLGGDRLKQLKRTADERHRVTFPTLEELRLDTFWLLLYLLLAALGLLLSVVACYFPQNGM